MDQSINICNNRINLFNTMNEEILWCMDKYVVTVVDNTKVKLGVSHE